MKKEYPLGNQCCDDDSSPLSLTEMPRNRDKTFCCGAGGGRMWMEEEPSQRVSVIHAREALNTGANTIAVGCPFCLSMMTDGVTSQDSSAQVQDIAEILAGHLGFDEVLNANLGD